MRSTNVSTSASCRDAASAAAAVSASRCAARDRCSWMTATDAATSVATSVTATIVRRRWSRRSPRRVAASSLSRAARPAATKSLSRSETGRRSTSTASIAASRRDPRYSSPGRAPSVGPCLCSDRQMLQLDQPPTVTCDPAGQAIPVGQQRFVGHLDRRLTGRLDRGQRRVVGRRRVARQAPAIAVTIRSAGRVDVCPARGRRERQGERTTGAPRSAHPMSSDVVQRLGAAPDGAAAAAELASASSPIRPSARRSYSSASTNCSSGRAPGCADASATSWPRRPRRSGLRRSPPAARSASASSDGVIGASTNVPVPTAPADPAVLQRPVEQVGADRRHEAHRSGTVLHDLGDGVEEPASRGSSSRPRPALLELVDHHDQGALAPRRRCVSRRRAHRRRHPPSQPRSAPRSGRGDGVVSGHQHDDRPAVGHAVAAPARRAPRNSCPNRWPRQR